MSDIIKSLLHHSQLANEYITKYYNARIEADTLQVALKYIIRCHRKGILTDELIESLLDLKHITPEIKNYINGNDSESTETI
jgi:hypothetical protein